METVRKTIGLQEELKALLRRVFRIRRGEEIRASFMLLYIFLVISSLMVVKPVCQSLFLSELGASSLPYAYVLVAVFAAGISSLYARMMRTISLRRLIARTLQTAIPALLLFWGFLTFRYLERWVLYAFFVWVAIFAVISVSQFWVLANMIFNPREAKRLFGFIGSGAIAGAIFGGYLTNLLAPVLGSENLIFVCIGFLGLCIPVSNTLWRETKRTNPELIINQQKRLTTIQDSPMRMILRSKHLTLLAGIMGISVVVAKLVDYQFSALASARIAEEDALTAFFGFWLSNLNIISLFIQLFVTRHVVGTFGVGTSLLFHPAGILVGAVGILVHPSLGTAVLLKMSDGSLKNSINKAGLELLGLPIPVEVKSQTKPFIDVFGDSLATGVGGILLILLTLVLGLPMVHIGFIIIVLLGFWIFMVHRVREEYIGTVRLKIERQETHRQQAPVDFRSASVIGGLITVLGGEDVEQILRVLRMIREIRNDRFVPCLDRLLAHPSREVRLEALRNLYFYRGTDLSPGVKLLVEEEDLDLQAEALHYLFQRETSNRIGLLKSYLRHQNPSLRLAALLCAARESRNNLEYQKQFRIRENVEALLKRLPTMTDAALLETAKVVCARIMGVIEAPDLQVYLHILLRDPSERVVREALASAGQTGNREFIPVLIRMLEKIRMETVALAALQAFGPDALDILVHSLNSPAEDRDIRLHIPKAIASFGTQKAANALIHNLEQPDPGIQHAIIKGLNRLRVDHPEFKFDDRRIVGRILAEARMYARTLAALYTETKVYHRDLNPSQHSEGRPTAVGRRRQALVNALETLLDRHLERIFRLLGLKYPPDDIYSIYLGVKSQQEDVRLNAVEFLDSVLSADLKRVIIPIVETTFVDALIDRTLEQFGLKHLSEMECLAMLLAGEDSLLKILTLELIEALQDPRAIPHIAALVNTTDTEVRGRAETVLKKLEVM